MAATGRWNSSVALATIPVFSRANIPFIVWGAITPKSPREQRDRDAVVPTLTNTNAPLFAQVGRRAAWQEDSHRLGHDRYGLANVKSFDKFFTDAGGAIVVTETAPVGTTDFRTVFDEDQGQRARCDLFGGVVTKAGLIRSQWPSLG